MHALKETRSDQEGTRRAEEAYNSFAATLRRLVYFDEASINLLDRSRQGVKVWIIPSTGDALVEPAETMSLEGSGTEYVTSTNKSLIEPDISQERRFYTDEGLSQQGYRAILRTPLSFSGEALGSLNLRSYEPGIYGEEERQAVEQLCAVLSQVIWYWDLAEYERERRLELEEQDKDRNQFIHVLAHELRTPLTPSSPLLRCCLSNFREKPVALRKGSSAISSLALKA